VAIFSNVIIWKEINGRSSFRLIIGLARQGSHSTGIRANGMIDFNLELTSLRHRYNIEKQNKIVGS